MKGHKLRNVWLSALTLAMIAAGAPARAAGEKIPEVKTLSGKIYRNVQVTKATPTDVSIVHEGGAARIQMTDLPEDLKAKLGYDPAKAEAHAAQEKDAIAKAAKNAASKAIVDRAYLQIVEGRVLQVVKGGILVDIKSSWDGKSYYIVPEIDYVPFAGNVGQGSGGHRNKNAGERKKAIRFFSDKHVFVSCDNSKFIDGSKFSGDVWEHGRHSYTDTTGAARTIPKYTTKPADLTKP